MRWFDRKSPLLGVDLGSHSIKMVECLKEGDQFRITGFGHVEVPTPEERADALADLLRHCNFKSKRAATSISGRSVIVRFLNMVEIPDENLKTAIRFEADRYIPYDLEEVLLDCHRVSNASGLEPNQMKVLLVAAKRELVGDHVSVLQAAGLQPRVVDVDAFAVGNAFGVGGATFEMAAGKVVALVDIGAQKSVVNVVFGGESHFTREIYLGGNDFTQGVAKRFGIETFEAEQLKRDPEGKEAEVTDALMQSLEDLGGEVQLSFDYFENQADAKVEEVFVSGGGGRVPGLEEVFERVFNRNTLSWNPIEGFEVDEGSVDVEGLFQCAPALGVAAGLATRVG